MGLAGITSWWGCHLQRISGESPTDIFGEVYSRATQRGSPAMHQAGCLQLSFPTAAGVPMSMQVPPRTFAPKVSHLAIP